MNIDRQNVEMIIYHIGYEHPNFKITEYDTRTLGTETFKPQEKDLGDKPQDLLHHISEGVLGTLRDDITYFTERYTREARTRLTGEREIAQSINRILEKHNEGNDQKREIYRLEERVEKLGGSIE